MTSYYNSGRLYISLFVSFDRSACLAETIPKGLGQIEGAACGPSDTTNACHAQMPACLYSFIALPSSSALDPALICSRACIGFEISVSPDVPSPNVPRAIAYCMLLICLMARGGTNEISYEWKVICLLSPNHKRQKENDRNSKTMRRGNRLTHVTKRQAKTLQVE